MGTGGRLEAGVLAASLLLAGCAAGADAPEPTQPSPTTTTQATASTSSSSPPQARSQQGPIVRWHANSDVIEGVRVSNPDGDCISILHSTEVIIRNSVIGPCGGVGVRVRNSSDVAIEDSELLEAGGGVYALSSSAIRVSGNEFRSTGRNPIQFDKVTGGGNSITGNVILNEPGNPDTEDSINVYMSGGLPDDPLLVARNLIRGGGSSPSGSGIMVGDHGGSHTEVSRNLLIEPGQVGIGVAGGVEIIVRDNVVYSPPHPWTNVGIYVWNQHESDCSSIEVEGNAVEFYASSGEPNRFFDGDNCGSIMGWASNHEADDLLGRLEEIERELMGAQ